MVSSPILSTNPRSHSAPPNCGPPPGQPTTVRRRSIPFRMLADAFGTEDEELDPEPDRADFVAWDRFH